MAEFLVKHRKRSAVVETSMLHLRYQLQDAAETACEVWAGETGEEKFRPVEVYELDADGDEGKLLGRFSVEIERPIVGYATPLENEPAAK